LQADFLILTTGKEGGVNQFDVHIHTSRALICCVA